MIVQSKRKNYESLYQYMTTTVDGVVSPSKFKTKEELDAKIKKMLNESGYSKDGFIVVQVVDYTIDATSYTDDAASSDEVSDNAGNSTGDNVVDNTVDTTE